MPGGTAFWLIAHAAARDNFAPLMKRWFITLLVLLLSTQVAAAAMCRYCDHSAEHAVGVHQVDVDAASDDSHAPPALGDSPTTDKHADAADHGACSVCHLGSASIPTATAPPDAVPHTAGAPQAHASPYRPSHIERIQRVPLALPASR